MPAITISRSMRRPARRRFKLAWLNARQTRTFGDLYALDGDSPVRPITDDRRSGSRILYRWAQLSEGAQQGAARRRGSGTVVAARISDAAHRGPKSEQSITDDHKGGNPEAGRIEDRY